MTDHTYEIRLGWANVYERPNTFSGLLTRLKRGKRFTGHEVTGAVVRGTDIWIARNAGGFVNSASVRDVGELSASERVSAAVERFYGAVVQRRADLPDATRGLIEVLTATGQVTVTQAAAMMLERLDEQAGQLDEVEKKMALHQRHLQQIDLILDEQARTREVSG